MQVFLKRYQGLFSAPRYRKDSLCAAQEFFPFYLRNNLRKLFLPILLLFFSKNAVILFLPQTNFITFILFCQFQITKINCPFAYFSFSVSSQRQNCGA